MASGLLYHLCRAETICDVGGFPVAVVSFGCRPRIATATEVSVDQIPKRSAWLVVEPQQTTLLGMYDYIRNKRDQMATVGQI
jgi:hypothetical protein